MLNEQAIQERLTRYLEKVPQISGSQHSGGPVVADILFPNTRPRVTNNDLERAVFLEARHQLLQAKLNCVFSEDDLHTLWALIHAHSYVSVHHDDDVIEVIDYPSFCQVRAASLEAFGEEKISRIFAPSTFCRFSKDEQGRIGIKVYFDFVLKWNLLQQVRVHLTYHDGAGDGNLRSDEVEAYIGELLPTLSALQGMPETFEVQYRRVASRKILFYLDTRRVGYVRIRDLLSSPILSELLELQDRFNIKPSNWFTLGSALQTYRQFLDLDVDKSGTLSVAEFSKYADGGLTDLFVERVFEVHATSHRKGPGGPSSGGARDPKRRRNEMDFQGFMDFVLAWSEKKHPVSVTYLFRVFDLNNVSYLTAKEIRMFFNQVSEKWLNSGQYPVRIDDVVDEIFDMVKPDRGDRISLKDLLRSGVGATVLSILADVTSFYNYDNRETLAAAQDDTEGGDMGDDDFD